MPSVGPRPRGAHARPRRFYWAQLIVVGAFLILAARLWQLQVISGEHYLRKSADNFVKDLELPAARGQLRDRKGRVLVDNRPSYNVYVTPRYLTLASLDRLGRYLHLSQEQLEALRVRVAQKRGLDRFRQLLALEDIGRDELATLESQRLELPGVGVESVAHRNYPHGTLGAHVLGYMNQISPEELANRRDQGYRPGDYVGRAGLERQWEAYLKGKDGVEHIVVDAKGQRKPDVETAELIGVARRVDSVPGHDVVTTLDLELERALESALAKHRSAAAAVVEVATGRVLALGSWPEPDPNRLTGRLTRAEAAELEQDTARPLIDKTMRENYFPGSTFKVVPMLAALEEGLVNPDEKVTCHGAMTFGRRVFHCVEVHGPVNLHQALAESCNVFFFRLGDRIGLDRLAQVAEDLGFGAPTGLGLNGEVPGFIPTVEYYEKHGGFHKGFVLNTAIGQGSVKITVLQLAMAYAAIANGGTLFVPQIVERIQTPAGKVVQEFAPRLRRRIAGSSVDLARVRAALYDAVNHPKGTSYGARVPGLQVAGKTGTAQLRRNHRGEQAEGDENNDHAWFASFAPAHHPEIAVVALVEHGGFGAKAAAPIAMEIYRSYFGLARTEQAAREPAEREPAHGWQPLFSNASGARP